MLNTIHAEGGRAKTTDTRITIEGGTQIYFKDQGTGQPVDFSHGWPLKTDLLPFNRA